MRQTPISQNSTQLSPWVTVVERAFSRDTGPLGGVFHSLKVHDYVTVLAVTEDGRVPLVRQYRPAIDRTTLELPGGLLDGSGSAEDCAVAELVEEVGYRPTAPLVSLGCLDPDTGRLENKLHGFFAPHVFEVDSWKAEPGLQRVMLHKSELLSAVISGEFTVAMHVALIGLAALSGRF